MTTPQTPPTSSTKSSSFFSSPRRRLGALIAGAALLSSVGVGAMAISATNAAFTGQTVNTGNQFDAATVTLTDDDGGAAMFTAANLIPGETATGCIEVTYTGSTTNLAALRVFGSSTGDLTNDLDLLIARGDAGSSCAAIGTTTSVYSGTLDAFGADYANGSAGLTPSATNETVAYQFDVTLDAATPNTEQGQTAEVDFTWEVRSN